MSGNRLPNEAHLPVESLSEALGDVQRIAFDLDGTVYDTRDFERPALAAVAEWLRTKSGSQLPGLPQRFWARRETSRHRAGLFDDLLVEYGLPAAWGRECLRRFHEYPAHELKQADSLRGFLGDLRARGSRLALVSNGPAALQMRKSDSLGLAGIFDACIYCSPDSPERQKPSAWAWSQLTEWRAELPTAYVGDDPADERFAESGGARFVPFRFRSRKYED